MRIKEYSPRWISRKLVKWSVKYILYATSLNCNKGSPVAVTLRKPEASQTQLAGLSWENYKSRT